MEFRRLQTLVVTVLLGFSPLAPAFGATLIIDDQTPGTAYDAILDGYPGFYTQDGVPDAGNNNLAVALKAGAVEIRSVAEFPLTGLAGYTASDIVSAKLRFNIDDVLGYLGAPLSGCAAENLAIWVRTGDGNIPLSDFIVAGPPSAVVNTGPPCSITDTTLGTTGPVFFEADITTALQSLVSANAPFLNAVWATNTDNTGTSLDNLGLNSTGPAGVRGARMPYLVIELAELPPPNLDAKTRRCQQVLAARSRAFESTVRGHLAACVDRVLADIAKGKGLTAAMPFCTQRLDLTVTPPSKIQKARQSASAAIVKACAPPAVLSDLGPPCDTSITDANALASCVLDRAFEAAQEASRDSTALLCRVLTAVGLQLQYNTSCTTR
ncbi:MAG: hypothetical protein N3C12_07240 [Candidatus Binatia bacterium]|nr:hypothetical protein [Candidatus Binatia bacterium]